MDVINVCIMKSEVFCGGSAHQILIFVFILTDLFFHRSKISSEKPFHSGNHMVFEPPA